MTIPYLHTLSAKQRLSISTFIITFLICTAFIALYWPSYVLMKNQTESLKQKQIFLHWLKRKTPYITKLHETILQKKPFEGESLLVITQHALEEMHLDELKPIIALEEEQGLTLHFDRVNFKLLAIFLQRLWEGNFIWVKELNTTALQEPGLVEAQIKLSKKQKSAR